METLAKPRILLTSWIMACSLFCTLVLGLAWSLAAQAAPKTDVIYLKNGDRITGEIKSLLRGQMELLTDDMGTVLIEWEQVKEIVSKTSQSVELSNGTRFFGPLAKAESGDAVRIETEEGEVSVGTDDVFSMYPVDASFWKRLDLSVKFGFSWDKSSQVGSYSLGIDGLWRDPRFVTRVNFVSEVVTQDEREDTRRNQFRLDHMRFLDEKLFRGLFGYLQQNKELGLDLRSLVGAGYGYAPVMNQRTLFGLMAGLAANHEVPDSGASQTNVELVGSLLYQYYLYAHPERHFDVRFNVFPSLTDGGRYRAELDASHVIELFTDLYWDLSIYGSYDNEPLSENASKSDYGITSSIGYNF